ncbi:hypothetical protein BBP40_002765 [Aspergillus hancockii]|nr:hypothetical protein BBP40_002765 [Aspergillus hancockii]
MHSTPNDKTHEPIVAHLQQMIRHNKWTSEFAAGIGSAVAAAKEDFDKAHIHVKEDPEQTIESFLDFCDRYVRWLPATTATSDEPLWMLSVFYFVFYQPDIVQYQNDIAPGESQKDIKPLSKWLHDYAIDLGKWMDDPASGDYVWSFSNNPEYTVYQYENDGWDTFNKFFARKVKPEYRPISPVNTVASPCDAKFDGYWPIQDGKVELQLKGIKWPIKELLNGSKYESSFNHGIFMHSFLLPHNYHRVHAPVSGKIVERKVIPGNVYLEVTADKKHQRLRFPPRRIMPRKGRNAFDDVKAQDNPGYQWNQVRGLWVFDTAGTEMNIGLVALFAVGMAQISSVNWDETHPKEGDIAKKGKEIAYLKYGGSDYILVFQDNKVHFDPESPQMDTLYLQGAALVSAIRN